MPDNTSELGKLVILVNDEVKMSRGKYASQAVHAALIALDVHPDVPVVVLGGSPAEIARLKTTVRDAGRTEVEPGTMTAGTDWADWAEDLKLRTIAGYCPMGCGATLFRGAGGYITCADLECPRPDAVATLLDDRESEHIVVLDDYDAFTIRHPLRERLADALMTCELHTWLASRQGLPAKPGRYRVVWRPDLPAAWQELADDHA